MLTWTTSVRLVFLSSAHKASEGMNLVEGLDSDKPWKGNNATDHGYAQMSQNQESCGMFVVILQVSPLVAPQTSCNHPWDMDTLKSTPTGHQLGTKADVGHVHLAKCTARCILSHTVIIALQRSRPGHLNFRRKIFVCSRQSVLDFFQLPVDIPRHCMV